MAKIYRVVQIKLNQLIYENVHNYDHYLTYQKSVFKRFYGDKHFSEFLPTRWRQK